MRGVPVHPPAAIPGLGHGTREQQLQFGRERLSGQGWVGALRVGMSREQADTG